jgi:hypothetical protein
MFDTTEFFALQNESDDGPEHGPKIKSMQTISIDWLYL